MENGRVIPYGRQTIDEADIAAVVESLRSDWLTQGPAIGQFETNLARQCGSRSAVACNSGTAALHMAYAAADLGPGSTVVVPANTFLATANAAIYLGAEVRFCDVDPHSGLMTPETLDAVLDESVAAVVPVHFAGQACDMVGIRRRIEQRCPRAVLIEDASHAIGGVYDDGTPVGRPVHASMITFSFHPVKHVAAGEGGAVTTDCDRLKSALERFRCHGMTKDPSQLQRCDEGPWYYEMHALGFNYRIPEVACALANSQLAKLDQFINRRRSIAAHYLRELDCIPGVALPPSSQLTTSAWHLFCLHIDFQTIGRNRAEVMAGLLERGIGTQVHYFPVALQPYYQNRYGLDESQFPGAMAHYRSAISIPMYPGMSDADMRNVAASVHQVLTSKSDAAPVAA